MSIQQSDEARRRFWYEQINAWKASGQSQQAFCKAHDLNYPRFGYWLRKFRQQTEAGQQATGFVPVVAQPSAETLSLRLPNGMELRGITSHNLSMVEQLISRFS
ncbi:MAG: hypothetical protein JMN27_17965 [gamma proteobacterium endosymbiont of Lamellibrachia anaximandri]|nr:hypothetical protein [gamma proteobacterium endosymbiont of Lamellibrachia anaximandri]MBL3535693.1 hypothetical protein [gamma proteobacterium endosymbiont of Lamellibrachia anaximandri]